MPEPTKPTTGFPNPATDHAERNLNLHQYAVRHEEATFFWRARGEAMREAGITDGDLLIVDRFVDARPGDVVVVAVAGEFLVRRWRREADGALLYTEHPDYPPLVISSETDYQIWGTVIWVLHNPNRRRR
jgi:DNA polymerase V